MELNGQRNKSINLQIFSVNLKIFSWSYEDLRGFHPNIIQHAIPVKEEEKTIRKRQRPINPTLEEKITKEVGKIINAHIIFSLKYL
jgi:hypothetical protein